ncbi:tape measure protein [Rheinheimera baltica]|uniref:tape measure protein n=1 Tax=Rheinheimera baltica TaxID=67576 RepID=UPI0004286801|nr:tape measure protein [Rheinheimera baltica]
MSKNLELALKIAATVTGDKDLARMADSVRDVGDSAAEADPKTEALASELDKLANQTKLIKEFDDSSQALRNHEIATAAVATKLEQLQLEAKQTGAPFVELAKTIDSADTQLEQMRQELAKQAENHNRLQTELKQTGLDTRKLSEEKRRVQTEFRRAATDVKKLGNDYLRANGQQRSFSQGAAGLTSRLVALAGTYLGLNRLYNVITNIFSTGILFEKLEVQFTALMGSFAGGEQATAWVKEFAKNTPLSIEEVSRAFVRLKAFGLDPMDGSLQAITDQALKLGGGFQEVEGISLALGQAWAKQKLQGEEILQLVERGVPVWDLLAQATGKNTIELQKLSEQGRLGRDVIRQLMDEIGKQAAGSAAANMGLLSGLISNAKDNMQQFYNLIATSGVMDVLKEQIAQINLQFEQMAADGRLQQIAQQISDSLSSIVQSGGGSLSAFLDNFAAFVQAVSALSGTIRIIFNGLSAGVSALAAAFTGAFSVMLNGYATLVAALGGDEISRGLKNAADFMQQLSKAYLDQVVQDGEDIKAAWAQITGEVEATTAKAYQTATQIVQTETDKQKQAIDSVAEAEKARVQQTEEAYRALGIASTTALQTAAENAQAAYEVIASGDEPIEQQRQAFLKWADAALAAAKATGDTVPQQIRAQAAALGLTSALDDLASKQGISFELSDKQSQSFNALKQAFDKTKLSIEFYKQTIDSSTASIEEKRLATLRLLEAEQLLQGQAEALLQVEQLKTKTFFEAQLALEDAKLKAEQITQAYMAGTLSTEQYNQQLQRQIMLIQILQDLVPDVKDDTEQHGDTQQNTGQQVDRTNQSIKEQSSALQSLSEDTDTATKYTSLYAGAQEWLRKQFDFSSSSSQDLAKRYDELTGFINQNRRAHNEWWRELARSSNAAFTREQQFISETLKVREYTAQLESSAATMQDVNRISMLLSSQFKQLGDNELAPLRNAITDAERRILSMRDSLEGTVNSLRDELDRLNNDQAAIEQRRYQQQLAELQAKLKEAQATGDKQAVATAQEALRLAKEIYAIKTAQFKEEQSTQAAAGTGQQQATTPTARTTARQPAAAPVPATTGTSATSGANTVRLELALPGKTYTATMAGNDAASLMRQIEREASTSL